MEAKTRQCKHGYTLSRVEAMVICFLPDRFYSERSDHSGCIMKDYGHAVRNVALHIQSAIPNPTPGDVRAWVRHIGV